MRLTDIGLLNNLRVLEKIQWANLVELDLRKNVIGSNGMKSLVKIQFPKMKKIILQGCRLSSNSMRTLTKLHPQNAPSLQFLVFDNEPNFDMDTIFFTSLFYINGNRNENVNKNGYQNLQRTGIDRSFYKG